MAQLLYVVKITCQIEPAIYSSAFSIANDVASNFVYFALSTSFIGDSVRDQLTIRDAIAS